MDVLVASPRGFCAGVDRAIEIVEEALDRFGPPVYVRHEIVHNQHVVNALREKGAIFVEDPEAVPEGSLLIFSAHGVSPAVRSAAERNGLQVIDATCPLVTKVHKEAVRLAKQGYDIVLIGHAGHVEVQGTMGHAPDRMHLVESVEDAEALEVGNPSMLGCVTQTTLSVDDTREIMETLRRRFPEILLPRRDDICYATQNRQNAVKKMTTKSDVVIVVGAPASSNSNRLVELAAKQGARSYLVQDASDIDPHWLTNTRCVGITAGASTPEVLVEEVVGRLTALGASNVVRQPAVDEGMVFPLPTSLR
ncbi:4-hydroxy-3-methylbut-2-enyl diphosphate reductase [Myxococcota bacterium]|nr:4-hydroxy-3-methylbut-2-enyl diphosphate reductase [Myxococcota bacterium]